MVVASTSGVVVSSRYYVVASKRRGVCGLQKRIVVIYRGVFVNMRGL